jgi:hypothetical protein
MGWLVLAAERCYPAVRFRGEAMKFDLIALVAASLASAAGTAPAGTLPECGKQYDDTPSVSTNDIDAHRQFDPSKPFLFETGPKAAISVNIDLVVDEQGIPVCADVPLWRDAAPTAAVRQWVASWRYTPFLKDGRPVRAPVSEKLIVAHAPLTAEMPQGPLFQSRLEVLRHACFGTCPEYRLTVRGTGDVTFDGKGFTAIDAFPVHYKISPGEVASLIQRMRSRGIWQLNEFYQSGYVDTSTSELWLTIGGQRKAIFENVGKAAGLPDSFYLSQEEIEAAAGADRWVHLTLDSLNELDGMRFPFHKQPGAEMLVFSIDDEQTSDDVVMAILNRGVPLTGRREFTEDGEKPKFESPLDVALASRREAVVNVLLDRGILLKKGRPDVNAVNSAFRRAMYGGHLATIERLLEYHPALTYDATDDDTDEKIHPSVLFLLAEHYDDNDNLIEPVLPIVKRLIAAGADYRGKDDGGDTLLFETWAGDPEITKYLIGLGLDVNAINHYEQTALIETYEEDVALVLLDAGADPRLGSKGLEILFERAHERKWTRVLDWLRAHGYAEPTAG